MELNVVTYNVQHFADFYTGRPAAAAFAEAIRRLGADIVGLNETYDEVRTAHYGPQAKTVAELLGFRYYFAEALELGEGRFYGNSLISRYPIAEARSVPVPDPEPHGYGGYYETRCVLCCTVKTPWAEISVAATHFGLNPDEQQNAVRTLLPLIEKERFILMGDLNVPPQDPVLLPLRERLRDTAEALPGPRMSFPADAPDRRIDHLFVSPDWRVLSADIPALVLSDHRPYAARLAL